jgi:thymidine kinase
MIILLISNKMAGVREPATIAKLTLITGPMGSRKTTYLHGELLNFAGLRSDKIRVAYINAARDDRAAIISSHGGKIDPHPNITYLKADNLAEVNVANFDVVGVDEAQFFPDLYQTVVSWLLLPLRIFVAGLSGDSHRQVFGDILKLHPECDNHIKLNSVCKPCLDSNFIVEAPFTGTMEKLKSGEVRVGGWDFYIPMCRRCHDQFLLSRKPPG